MEVALGLPSSAKCAVGPSRGFAASRSSVVRAPHPRFLAFNRPFRFSDRHFKSESLLRQGTRGKHAFAVRPSSSIRAASFPSPADSGGSSGPTIAPLELKSPVGQFLSQILISHPHLVPAAVEQQLQQLQTDIDNEKSNNEKSALPTTDLVLYRRIAEVKANDRKRALEEILYALIVQKFMEADVSLIPSVSQSSKSSNRVDNWRLDENKHKQLHSPEAYEMIKNHLQLILGHRLSDSNMVAPISKLRVGQVYAASVMYGYFLRRVDERFQLEKRMKSLTSVSEKNDSSINQASSESPGSSSQVGNLHPEVLSWSSPGTSSGGNGFESSSTPLRTYVMSFDSDMLQKFATIRSKEAFSIIEKHTEALFGRPEITITPQGTVDSSKDELLKISFSGLKTLILEAVTFGSFLWDVESHVDSRYHFVAN